jgi:hypothetical protein
MTMRRQIAIALLCAVILLLMFAQAASHSAPRPGDLLASAAANAAIPSTRDGGQTSDFGTIKHSSYLVLLRGSEALL